MTDLERMELVLRSIKVDDTWTPTELVNALIEEIIRRNTDYDRPDSAVAAELEWRRP